MNQSAISNGRSESGKAGAGYFQGRRPAREGLERFVPTEITMLFHVALTESRGLTPKVQSPPAKPCLRTSSNRCWRLSKWARSSPSFPEAQSSSKPPCSLQTSSNLDQWPTGIPINSTTCANDCLIPFTLAPERLFFLLFSPFCQSFSFCDLAS